MKEILKSAITVSKLPFKLASGGSSHTMLDTSKVLRTKAGQNALIAYLKTREHDNFDCVGGPLCGAELVASAVCQAWNIAEWFGIRKEPKGRGYDSGHLTGNLKVGDKVLLVEDVCTTGSNVLRCIPHIAQAGGILAGVLVVVDRGGLQNVQEKTDVKCTALFTLEELTKNSDK